MSTALPELRGRIALGTATPSIRHEGRDRAADIAAMRAGFDAGIGIVDTARAYSRADDPSSGEALVAEALVGNDEVLVMTKGGHWRVDHGTWRVDNGATRLRQDAEQSLRTLGRERLDVFLLHRADDTATDFDESLDALLAIRADGLAARVGLSNATAEQLEHAASRGAADVVQNPHSAAERNPAALAVAESRGIPYFAYSPLRAAEGATLAETYPLLATIATARGASLARLVLRGILSESAVLSVVSGATRAESVRDSAAAPAEPWDSEADEAYHSDLTHHLPLAR